MKLGIIFVAASMALASTQVVNVINNINILNNEGTIY